MRRFNSLVKTSSSSSSSSRNGTTPAVPIIFEDDESRVATVRDDEVLPVPSLKVKRVDHYYSRWGKTWKYRNMSSKVTVESVPIFQTGSNDPWKDYSFVLVRKVPKMEYQEPTFKIVIKSGYIVKACQDVIKTWPGISWNAEPLELDPDMFITFYDKFVEYRDTLESKKQKTDRETYILSSVNLLLSTISTDYRTTLSTVDRLTSHGEITFEFIYTLLVPRTLFVATCAITGGPRLFRLTSYMRTTVDGKQVYQLYCESFDLVDKMASQTASIGKVQTTILLHSFKGTAKITDLDVYPLKYHPDPSKLRAALLLRGKKWFGLNGVHHMQYNGIAASKRGDKITKHNVNGRIMIDRATFRRLNPNYQFPIASLPTMTPVPWQLQYSTESLQGPEGRMPPPLPPMHNYLPPPPGPPVGPYDVTWSSPYANGA
ncbi:hypothetical protein H0H87_000497 [Tephrocybe sp. NHM501043]|nr:hypothetical protein H0H87_000497 [Tephrocybe sp. NHM501043]